jgi:branched-chain amino acid transport system ATP-binding protein
MTSSLLELRAIHTFIDQYHILEGVDLTVPEGEIVALLGRNGAGKTTTLRTVMGLNPASSGSVVFKGEDITRWRSYEIASEGIGYVPEHRAVFGALSVEENLRLAERRKGDLARKAELIYTLFPDLERLSRHAGNKLSGGQQQMLAVARALVPDNDLLLIDEPSEGLAPVLVEQMVEAIKRLSDSTTVLLVEQNLAVATSVASSFAIVEEGRTVATGAMADLVDDKEMIRKYLGAA